MTACKKYRCMVWVCDCCY